MKTFLRGAFALSFLLLIVLPVHAAGSWEEVESGTINSLQAITRSGGNLIAVGNSGETIYSTDGAEWMKAEKIASTWVYDLAEKSSTDVYAVGNSATLMSTSDGGVTWSPMNIDATEHFYAIDFEGDAGHIVGTDGSFYYYSEGIKKWLVSSESIDGDIWDVDTVTGTKVAYAVGNNGSFSKTLTDGTVWTKLGTISTEHLYGVHFSDEQQGWVVGSNGEFLKTDDGGSSWVDVSVDGLAVQHLRDIDRSGDVIVVAGDAIVIRSEDAGGTWEATTFDDVTLEFQSAHVDDDGTSWVAGTKDDVWSKVYSYAIPEPEPEPEPDPEPEEDEPEEDPVVDFGEAKSGDLIKTECVGEVEVNDPCKAIYFLSSDGARHAFPNEKIYFTWYSTFEGIVEVSKDFMSDRTLGKNVTYHPGKRMVKFLSVPTVYAVEQGGVLRAINSEAIASTLYGENWNQMIDDIPDAFFGNYTFGQAIQGAGEYDKLLAEASVDDLNDNF